MDLAKKMAEVMEFIQANLTSDHWHTCRLTADKFGLWDEGGRFPLWLSYIVAGAMRDQGQ